MPSWVPGETEFIELSTGDIYRFMGIVFDKDKDVPPEKQTPLVLLTRKEPKLKEFWVKKGEGFETVFEQVA